MKDKKNILLCVAGMSPQIITETLYALTQERENKIRIDEVRVITTLDGRDKVTKVLLDAEKGIFYQFCRDFKIDSDSIKFDETCISLLRTKDGRTLDDIRTPQENELAGDQICEIVRELCKNENTRIFASAAGGRKTMSIYLTLAMSLFGRAEDELSHVLVNEGFESNTFFYPPPKPIEIDYFNPQTKITKKVNTAEARIYLAPIPFIRFRGIGKENEKFAEARSYGEIVNIAQKVLDVREKEYDLTFDFKKDSVFVRGEKVKFTSREFFFYLIFCRRRKNGSVLISLNDITKDDFHNALKTILLAKKNEDVDWEEIFAFPKYKFAETMYSQLFTPRKSTDFDDFRDSFSTIVTRIRKAFQKVGIDDERYYLVSTDDGTASYKLSVKGELIKI
jgi:CRISPR-associated protein (TIGR02584 family)